MTGSTHLPFFEPLFALWIGFLHCNWYADADLGRGVSLFIDPSLKNPAKTSFTQHRVWSEVSGGALQLCESEHLQIGRYDFPRFSCLSFFATIGAAISTATTASFFDRFILFDVILRQLC